MSVSDIRERSSAYEAIPASCYAHAGYSLLMTPERWFRRLLDQPGVRLADMSPELLIASSFLPGKRLRDPADRIIAATARGLGARLVTRDRAHRLRRGRPHQRDGVLRGCGAQAVARMSVSEIRGRSSGFEAVPACRSRSCGLLAYAAAAVRRCG
jgi:PIN domain nuclease of toxin-antitoxin system